MNNEDYSKKVKDLIKEYNKEDIEYGKPLDYLAFRNKITKEEIEEENI